MADRDEEPRPSSASAVVVLPPLPESQLPRPPSAPGRRAPTSDTTAQQDDHFVLPRIDNPAAISDELRQPQPAVSTRVPGSKTAKDHDVGKEGGEDAVAASTPAQRDTGTGKEAGQDGGGVGAGEREGARDAGWDGRQAQGGEREGRGGGGGGGGGGVATGSRAGETKPAVRRGPLPSQRKAMAEASDGRTSGPAGQYWGVAGGSQEKVGKAGPSVGAEGPGMMRAEEGHVVSERDAREETQEERLERIRTSNIRKDFREGAKGGGAGGSGGGALSTREADEMNRVKAPSSPRRARAAEHEFGHKATFHELAPEMVQHRAERRGQELAFPYAKMCGTEEGSIDLELLEVKSHLRATALRFVDKAAPDLESKPPPALSVEAGPSAKHKELQDLPEIITGSDQFPRGENGEGRKAWYGKEGDRADLLRLPMSGISSNSDNSEFRLQPATAHGIDVGFERTMAHSRPRGKGEQLNEKDLSLGNFQTPSGGYKPSNPNRFKHEGSDGARAEARAEVAVAAPIKLPRQEGFMVDRDKDAGIDKDRVAAVRETADRDQAVTRSEEITEESRLAQKYSKLLQGPGKLEDTDYDVLDTRPSELALKIKEKRGAYAVPKGPGHDERRDARPIPMDLQLKPPNFLRQKGSGEDKMRSAYY